MSSVGEPNQSCIAAMAAARRQLQLRHAQFGEGPWPNGFHTVGRLTVRIGPQKDFHLASRPAGLAVSMPSLSETNETFSSTNVIDDEKQV